MAAENTDQSKLFQKVPSDDPYFKMNEVAQQLNNVPKSWMVSQSKLIVCKLSSILLISDTNLRSIL